MAKKTTASNLTLSGNEQSSLRLLLALREQANASAAAANAAVRNYLVQLLQGRGLDHTKWGVSPDMTTFTEIQQPQAPAQPTPAAVASAAAPAAPGAPGAPATFAQSTPPAPAPAAAPAQ